MNKKNLEKHEFAFFLAALNYTNIITITDKDLMHRITTVLRLGSNEPVILFNTQQHISGTIKEITKKNIIIDVHQKAPNKVLTPAINWLLPLLEREAFEEALYVITAMGATTIQPVITKKSRQQWGKPTDMERVMRIMISAAEQSKQFVIPEIKTVKLLEEVTTQLRTTTKIFFDAAGDPAWDVLYRLQKISKEITCLVGPEGDLTQQEKEHVQLNGFISCALTPTILRASHAVTVSMGIMRSLL